MTVTWTPEQVLSFSLDEASRKHASGLANPRKWKRLFQYENDSRRIVWGEYQGSGSDPYRCQVDVSEPVFKCSCPSKKVPCKHALGLFLLFASQPGAFETSELPDWIAAWLVKRAEKGEKRAGKTEGRAPKADGQAQVRRAAERDRKIRAGLDELETWLRDLLRQGLAAAQNQPRSFWETAAARLVDAQAPGLARIVREDLAGAASSGDGWQDHLLDGIARLYLALEGYRRIETLPGENQADLRTVIGFNLKQEDLIEDSLGISDTWLVLGRELEDETKLRVQRVWLWGQTSHRPALILSFAPPGGTLDASLMPGMAFPGELIYYPGAAPLRALVRTRQPAQPLPAEMPGCSLLEATARFAAALSAYPWLERYPLALREVIPVNEEEGWALYDADQRRVGLSRGFQHGWTLQAISGGRPLGVFGIWNGERLQPLSAWADGEFYSFRPTLE